MPEARLNFIDHPDGSWSCNAVFFPLAVIGSSYDPRSKAHQACRILKEFLDTLYREAPDDGRPEIVEVNRPTLDTEAYIHLEDYGDQIRLRRVYLPAKPGYVATSEAHQACAKAHRAFNYLHRAETDAIVSEGGEGARIITKELINAMNQNV